MSGLLALLDDVASISKVAAASIDDVTGQAVKAGAKAAGAVIDDAAVTPKYVHGFDASREIPIVWKIARGSLFNKLVILLPVALLLSQFAPWAIAPLLMLGGAYLCYEGAEKVAHALGYGDTHDSEKHTHAEGDGAALEEARVAGAIKTDFILSAEIMTIALATIPPEQGIVMKGLVLLAVAVAITVAAIVAAIDVAHAAALAAIAAPALAAFAPVALTTPARAAAGFVGATRAVTVTVLAPASLVAAAIAVAILAPTVLMCHRGFLPFDPFLGRSRPHQNPRRRGQFRLFRACCARTEAISAPGRWRPLIRV